MVQNIDGDWDKNNLVKLDYFIPGAILFSGEKSKVELSKEENKNLKGTIRCQMNLENCFLNLVVPPEVTFDSFKIKCESGCVIIQVNSKLKITQHLDIESDNLLEVNLRNIEANSIKILG